MMRSYYDTELRFLREAGRAFAEAYPSEARHLNLDSLDDRDPFVERLFEGFAFLAGRIHQRLDDEMPHYTEGLLQLLCPHFLKPFPSCCILSLDPEPGLLPETTRFAAGLEVRSPPVGPERTVCRFRTTEEVRIHPLRLAEASIQDVETDRSRLSLSFALHRGASLQRLDLSRLRLYLHTDASDAATLYRYLTRCVRRVSVRADSHTADLPGQRWVQSAGFTRSERLLPAEAGSFSGLQMLQEYFCFRPRFWFVDVLGLDNSLPTSTATSFDVDLHFDRPAPPEGRVEPDTLRLHCVPAVNLFEVDAEPIRIHGRAAEYRIVPDVHAPRSVAAYDVQSVVGTEEETGRRHMYRPFYTFPHGAWTAPPPTPSPPTASSSPASRSPSSPSGRHFTTSRRTTPQGTLALYLSLGGTERPSLERAGGETLTVGIRATNGSLPRDALSIDTLTRLAPGTPQIVRPTNLTRPTPFLPAPDREQFQWSLLAHLAFNFQSVASRDALSHLLRLYDWTASDTRRANRRRIDGIRSVSWTPTTALHDGAVVRGLHLCLEVSESHFPSRGDLCLFGDVLYRFLAAYATINTCVQLSVVGRPSGRSVDWMPTAGTRPPL